MWEVFIWRTGGLSSFDRYGLGPGCFMLSLIRSCMFNLRCPLHAALSFLRNDASHLQKPEQGSMDVDDGNPQSIERCATATSGDTPLSLPWHYLAAFRVIYTRKIIGEFVVLQSLFTTTSSMPCYGKGACRSFSICSAGNIRGLASTSTAKGQALS